MQRYNVSEELNRVFGTPGSHSRMEAEKQAWEDYNKIVASIPSEVHKEVEMQLAISNRIYELMTQRGLSKSEFARAIGKRPCEITKWLSGQHNFTVRTLALLSAFFGVSLIQV